MVVWFKLSLWAALLGSASTAVIGFSEIEIAHMFVHMRVTSIFAAVSSAIMLVLLGTANA